MTPEAGSPLVSFQVPLDYWYESPVGWVIVLLMLVAIIAVAAVLIRMAWLRLKR